MVSGAGAVPLIAANDPYIWGIAFGESSGNWFDRIFRKGFRHCYCWREHEGGILVYNYMAYRYDVAFYPVKFADFGAYLLNEGHKVLFYTHKPQVQMVYRLFFNCVSAVEAAIGLKLRLVFTPYGLYGALKLRGATELEVTDD